ncbi:AAA family ATPase [Deinococcus yavapaiensis]|uniref:Putative ATPase n=1 Tax=Deinococcus yavapaiensis KR-236 TaxID=694435 RepID=A0A318SIS8_9DEIO|nr:AAA family ATPase [Deinococcus yavapaiensis]PYE51823.1 putative ATPase [Deinococcus yavapaiensis KR-236]
MHLTGLRFNPDGEPLPDGFPFSLSFVRDALDVSLTRPVTLLVGENGSGKSTFLEALARATELPTAGAHEAGDDPTLHAAVQLEPYLRLSWSRRTRRGLFLRAEDYFGFVRRADRMLSEAQENVRRIEAAEGSKSRRAFPYRRAIGELTALYGPGLDARSHGESFLAFFQARLTPGGLHLIDEPEAAMSPSRQLAFMSLVKDLVRAEAQFIIATHSPMLLALPAAQILLFDASGVREAVYEELEHVRLMREFLADPEAYLRYL